MVSFEVDDDVWAAVHEGYDRLCTTCFDELADQKDVPYVIRALHQMTWSQGIDGWPHLHEPCAECAGRRSREKKFREQEERRATSGAPA